MKVGLESSSKESRGWLITYPIIFLEVYMTNNDRAFDKRDRLSDKYHYETFNKRHHSFVVDSLF